MDRLNFMPFLIVITALVTGCTTPSTLIQNRENRINKSGYAPINGINMYYEIYGSGDGTPLVLLNGGGSTINVAYGRILPILSKNRTVIALEEQGHGRTTDRNLPFRSETSAEDIAALLKYLNIPLADVMGFSNGAGVAMQMAIRHPTQVRRLIFVSYMTKKNGAHPWLWDMMKTANLSNMPQILKDEFLKVTPDSQKLRTMCEKDIERMQNFVNVPDKEVRSIRIPTLIVIGDKDVIKPEHAIELSQTIPNSRLMILPGGHGEFLGELLTWNKASHAYEFTAGFIEEFLGQ